MPVQMQPVESAALTSVGYDPQAQELHVQFKSGGQYAYSGVTPQQHQQLVGAPSIGRHLQENIIKAGHKHRLLGRHK